MRMMRNRKLVGSVLTVIAVICISFYWGSMPWNAQAGFRSFEWKGEQIVSEGITYTLFTSDDWPVGEKVGTITADTELSTPIYAVQDHDPNEMILLKVPMLNMIYVNEQHFRKLTIGN